MTEEIINQCLEAQVGYVWMHCMMGTKRGLVPDMTSVSQDAVRICRENSINVIPGSCPAQFLNPDFGHRLMRGLWGLMGNLKVE